MDYKKGPGVSRVGGWLAGPERTAAGAEDFSLRRFNILSLGSISLVMQLFGHQILVVAYTIAFRRSQMPK